MSAPKTPHTILPIVRGFRIYLRGHPNVRITFLGNHQVDYSSESHHAKTLEDLGHTVVRLQEGQASGAGVLAESLQSDLLVVVHTHNWVTPGLPLVEVLRRLREVRIPTATFHLDLWVGLERQRDLESDPFYKEIDHFFTVDRLMADWFNEKTAVRGHFLPAGVFDRECYISTQPSEHANDVIFVGSKRYHREWNWRPQLVDFLRDTYGSRFTHIGGDGDTGTLRGDALNRAYANSKVAVGDTLCLGFTYPWYASDRLFEAPGRGGFQLFPRIAGIDTWFDGTMRFFNFGDLDGLKSLIDYYLQHDDEREDLRRRCHQHVKTYHTYRNRWETILETVFP